MLNEPQPVKASVDFVEKWNREFKSFGWGRENYERKVRQRLSEEIQLEEGETIVFAATSGGWLVWAQTTDATEAGLALAIVGTNRRTVIWTSRALDSGLSRFRELRHGDLKEVQELSELRVGRRVHEVSGLIFISFRDKDETLGVMVAGNKERAALLGFLNEAVSTPITVAVDRLPEGGDVVDSHGERRQMSQNSLTQGLEEVANKVRLLEHEKRDAVAKTEVLERELREAVARIEALEHDQRQSAATIEALERAERQSAANIEALERAQRQAAVTIQELEHEKKQASVTIRGLEREVGELTAFIAQANAKVSEILRDGGIADVSQPAAVNKPEEPKALDQVGELAAAPQGEVRERPGRAWRFD